MFLRLTSSTLALTVLAAPAFALTPEEVWNAWISEYARTGYTVTEGAREVAGEVLTLTDVAFVQQAEGETLRLSVPRIVLTGTGDGNVRTDFGEAIAVEMQTRDGEDRPVTVNGTVRTAGMEVLSSGDAGARTDKVTAPSLVLTLDRIDLPEGEDLVDVASVTLTDLAAEAVSRDAGHEMTSNTRAAKVDYAVNFADAEGSVKATGSIEGLEGSGEVTLPDGADLSTQMNAALKAGALLGGTVKLGAGNHELHFTATSEGETQDGTATATAGGAEVSFRLAQDGLAYQGAASDLAVEVMATGMPVPVSYALEEATFDLQGPVMAAEAPAPFKFAYSLGGVTLGDEVWGLFDPAKQLPRDPASLDLDLTGMVRLTGDLFDPRWMAAASGEAEGAADAADAGEATAPADADDPAAVEGAEAEVPADGSTEDTASKAPTPFEVTEVTINQFALNAAGVKAEATGKLAAPEGGDISAPVGSISARYEGLNGLIDTLVAMGVISQDEVMGYRMMLTMFARPGEGNDVLTTELQFNEGGEVLANGQKIK